MGSNEIINCDVLHKNHVKKKFDSAKTRKNPPRELSIKELYEETLGFGYSPRLQCLQGDH